MDARYEVYHALDILRGTDNEKIPALKQEVQTHIMKIGKLRLRREMQMRYIDDMTWDEIADAMARNRAETSDAPRKRITRYLNTLKR